LLPISPKSCYTMTHRDTSGRYGNPQKAAKNAKIPDFGWYYDFGKLGGGSLAF
jgi:hypothetical protein